MILRSSSTPLLGSLLSSYSESPNHKDYETHNNNNPSSDSFIQSKKISFTHGGNSLNFSSYSTCNNKSTSLTRSIIMGLERAQSDGNLKGLVAASCDMEDQELFSQFSSMGSGEFTFDGDKLGLIQENEEDNQFSEFQYLGQDPSSLFLATGLGIGVNGGTGGGGFNFAKYGEGKKMLEAHPSSALFLRNYAQFLYKLHHDYEIASSYFKCAVKAAPEDFILENLNFLLSCSSFLWETWFFT
ncbi:hypothetical protein MKW92_052214 [Papaver armeniacum]|nr:hypothetical protein MKW92_052214 [Papaver armeniacum]